MGFATNKTVLDQIEYVKGEKVIFSCVVVKYNRFGMKQERALLLTNFNLYNIKKDQVKRRIDIADIRAMTKSSKPACKEFVIHVFNQYDYRFESDKRPEIFDAIKYVCWRQRKSNLKVYEVPDTLKSHHTSKKDILAGNDIYPPEKYIVA